MDSQRNRAANGALRARLRHGLDVIFRHRRLVTVALAAMLSTTALAAALQPARYEAHLKILVKRDRVDSPVTATREVQAASPGTVSEEELQSEIQILTSRGLFEQVTRECQIDAARIMPGLQDLVRQLRGGRTSAADRLEAAVRHLERRVHVEVVKKSHVLSASYEDSDPTRARCVLDTLSAGYLQRHMELRRPAGTLAFFQEETDGYREKLARLQSRMAAFNDAAGVASMELEKELAVRRLREAQAGLFETRERVAEVAGRIETLRASLVTVPARRTTQIRVADNGQLMEQLQSSLLALEQKRTELLTRYAPGYRLVQEVEQQIGQARAAVAAAAASPLRDETTDNDPTHEWVRTELARAESELSALHSRDRAAARTVQAYQQDARALAQRSLEYEDLQRQVKAEEENYLLYLRKQEEARISEALDQQNISNLAIAEPVNVSGTPTSRRAIVLLVGVLFSLLGSSLLAVVADAWDPTFRTPDELATVLELPVLATLSRQPGVPEP